jgi:hypothetical protein
MRKVGRFVVNEKLTRMLDVKNWVIYRDPAIGLYAFNEKENEELYTGYYSASSIFDIERFLESVRSDITAREIKISEMKNFDKDAVLRLWIERENKEIQDESATSELG